MKNLLLSLFLFFIPAYSYAQDNLIHAATFNGSNGFTLAGGNKEDLSGASVSGAGDINNDGYDDFLIGAYLADDVINAHTDAGKVYVVFGREEAFDPLLQLSTLDGSNGFTITGKTADHQLGWSVSSAGDFNGDGIDDLLLGAPSTSMNDNMLHMGEAYLIFGKMTGFAATLDLTTLNGTNGFTIVGDKAFDFFGYAVDNIGSINGDQYDDIIISAPFASPNQKSKAGIAYIIFGHSGTSPVVLNVADLDGANGFQVNGQTAHQFLGYSVSGAGNFDNDNFDDVLIGAYSTDLSTTKIDAGQSYLIYGKDTPYDSNIELTSLSGSTGFAINGISAGDFSGWAVSEAGDINTDGYGDILIGAPAASNPKEQAGEVYVLFGKTNRPTVFNLNTLDGSNGFTLKGMDIQDHVGVALSSVGDANDDSYDDFLIGAKNVSINGFASGAAYLFFGKDNMSDFSATFNLSTLDATSGLSILGKNKEHQLGGALSGIGDIDKDGINDFIIGAKGADANGTAAGESYVVTDITACAASAGFILNSSSTISNFEICQGTDLLDNTQASAPFIPSYGGLNSFDVSVGFSYAMLLVNANNTIISTAFAAPYDFDFSTLSAGTYTIYGLMLEEGAEANTISTYLSAIQSDNIIDDITQIKQDDNDSSSGGLGNGNLCLDLKNFGLDGTPIQITILPAPVITANDIKVCVGNPLMLTVSSPDANVTYEWTHGDFSSVEQNPIITTMAQLSDIGIYSVTASSNQHTCTTIKNVSVLVDTLPVVTISDSLSVCIGETITLSAAVDRMADYTWTRPPSTSTINPSILNSSLSNQGLYQVDVVDEFGCTVTETTELFVNNLPVITAPDITAYEGDVLQLNASFIPNAVYHWYGPNDTEQFLSQQYNPIIPDSLDNPAGSYLVEVTDSNACKSIATLTLNITERPPFDCSNANLSVETSAITVVEGDPIQLSASFVAGVTYGWVGPNNFRSTQQNPLVTENATTNELGNYTVTIIDENNCDASDVAQVMVEAFVFNCADAELEVEAADFVVEEGEAIQLTATSATGLSYQWSGPNNFTSTQQNPILTNSATLNDAGNYLVEVTDANNCTETDLAIIMISGSPATCTDDVIVSANPANNEVVMAKKTIETSGTVIIGNNKNVIFQAGENIILKAGFSVTAGSEFLGKIADCSVVGTFASKDNKKEILNSLPSSQIIQQSDPTVGKLPFLQTHPNPFKNQTTITYQLVEDGAVQLTLYDLQGSKRKDLIQKPTALAGSYTINLQNDFLTEGFYLLVLTTKQGIQTKKLVVLK